MYNFINLTQAAFDILECYREEKKIIVTPTTRAYT